ncbi:MAG: hypothetical protein HY815_19080 [Candidatus Riflebacteria bacterium]|nr:hypothetical protein [Candidatus Riflebacteria bacterium]
MTPTPVVGMLSVSSGGATTRESAPCQAHALAVHGLEPGVDVECRVRSPDGATLDSWRERLPTVQQTVADFVELLGRATDPAFFDEIRNEHAASRGGQGSSGQTLERHRALYLQRMGQLPRAAAAYGQVKDRMADTPEIDARLRSQLLKRLWDALDLEEFFRSQLKVEPVHSVASVLGPGTAAEATVPGGLEKLWSLRFDDGGRSAGRPVLPDGPGTTVVAGPAHFRERLIGFLDRTTGAPTRTSYHHPGPLAPPGGLRRACIGFRIAGGDPLERLVLRVGPPGKRGKLLACFRKSGTPALGEGSFRVDERLLSDRSLGLNVELVTSSPTRVGQGIVLDHLTLYGERILAGR